MKPRNHREFIKPVSSKLQVSEELVSDVVAFYWKEVRLSLTKLKHHRILVSKFGTFSAKPWRIDDVVQEFYNKFNYIEPTTIGKYEAKQEYLSLYQNAVNIAEAIKQEESMKKNIKQKRKEYDEKN